MLVLKMAEAHASDIVVHMPTPGNLHGRDGWGFDLETELRLAARLKEIEDAQQAILAQREIADAAVLRDFRARIASGEIILTGLRTKPLLDSGRSIIPCEWAELLELDWDESSVRAAEVVFVAVTAEHRPISDAAAFGGSQPASAGAATVEELSKVPHAGGRENYNFLIKEALLAYRERALAREVAGTHNKVHNTTIAKSLLGWLEANYPDRKKSGHLPSLETIRTRFPKM
jgi:hypothetical protein